ncbi:bifunctional ornithine acetyltransferase/N-acetylglutamate synthase [Streptomyces clavuligerus]|uniref:bifunctional ornithine acetyltransferase/N-acetylglutamate synthase n=2 Tax=Streptomyces clavuligerus TaxID=1901 RepID=UPI00020D9619|nr:bifunctional ornithine acetyltransferase/N-acetylglutamate synthase [Streptomyces clavuligerus]MBY6306989.1 bifunctional ornithine acetyltransferase/N-acetylglutamate synthase [Streptomyces clavuligerus]QPL67051.1 bifunctional ornithine acetyltransferase/N-acetylglutamate synthase [Streptomyces clavuligerus]QPL73081.1 bifunctional ornithine acetyltransferase/N-acetylglutamate synthase [Streptomyces clavuligerus]QPL79154.1 bifunctional ornithine acetyltransferase/N-acetylglutamate synthase [S
MHHGHAGIRGSHADLAVIASDVPAAVGAVFTRSRFAAPSVLLSRDAVADGIARGVVVLSGNANAGTGPRGYEDAAEVRHLVAGIVDCDERDVLIASTGPVGERYPMSRVRAHLRAVRGPLPGADFDGAAAAVLGTAGARPTIRRARCGDATLIGVAKGPGTGPAEQDDRSTLAFFCTDAQVSPVVLDDIFRRVADRAFHGLGFGADASTGDTAAVLANGLAGRVDLVAFEQVLGALALDLVRDVVRDSGCGGALVTVRVTGAHDTEQAGRVGRAVVDAPSLRAAVHGPAPDWAPVAAVAGGHGDEGPGRSPGRITIRVGGREVFPAPRDRARPDAVTAYPHGGEVTVHIDLGVPGRAPGAFTVHGCDLLAGYPRLGAGRAV